MWQAHHSDRVRGGDDGAVEERLHPAPVVGVRVPADDRDEHHVDADARERERKDLRAVAEEGVPLEVCTGARAACGARAPGMQAWRNAAGGRALRHRGGRPHTAHSRAAGAPGMLRISLLQGHSVLFLMLARSCTMAAVLHAKGHRAGASEGAARAPEPEPKRRMGRKVSRNNVGGMLCTQCCALRLVCWHAPHARLALVERAELSR